MNEFPSYCENHKHQVTVVGDATSNVEIPVPDTKGSCPICLQDVSADNDYDVMTPRCCNKAILHKNCIKVMSYY